MKKIELGEKIEVGWNYYLNDWYETYQTACGLKKGCMGK
jgi:hypothetical protein